MWKRKLFWYSLIVSFCSVFFSSSVLGSETDPESMLKLSICVPESNGIRAIHLSPNNHFHVVLENKSKIPQKIWKDSNSWGYSILYFEVTDETGIKQIIRKRPRDWRKNAPGFWLLNPGEQLVYNVSLTNGEWDFEFQAKSEARRFKMRAVIEIPEDDHSRKIGVWTGLIRSTVYEIDFLE